MDWFTWLSNTGLEPSLVQEYGLAFLNNELEEDDIPYLNHEFLQSMGISIAKHRLEILKLAKKEANNSVRHPMSRILIMIKRTKIRLSKYLRHWNLQEESALSLVPKRSYSGRWRSTMMLKRNKKAMAANKHVKGPLLLTYGSPAYRNSRIESFSSPFVYHKGDGIDKIDEDHDDEYWTTAVEEMRWDTMFQNLKPT